MSAQLSASGNGIWSSSDEIKTYILHHYPKATVDERHALSYLFQMTKQIVIELISNHQWSGIQRKLISDALETGKEWVKTDIPIKNNERKASLLILAPSTSYPFHEEHSNCSINFLLDGELKIQRMTKCTRDSKVVSMSDDKNNEFMEEELMVKGSLASFVCKEMNRCTLYTGDEPSLLLTYSTTPKAAIEEELQYKASVALSRARPAHDIFGHRKFLVR